MLWFDWLRPYVHLSNSVCVFRCWNSGFVMQSGGEMERGGTDGAGEEERLVVILARAW